MSTKAKKKVPSKKAINPKKPIRTRDDLKAAAVAPGTRVYTGKVGKQIKTVADLFQAAEAGQAVCSVAIPSYVQPAAYVINQSARKVIGMIVAGLYVYTARK